MDALANAPLKWLFERCVFEESTLELSVDGVVVELERKPLEVLRHLLRHAGEVVTKEEIHAAVWPGRVLSDTVLTKAVSRIREVLGDDAQTLIKTVHGYGYRLIAPVRVEAALLASSPAPALGLKAGESPPLRAQWRLDTHLGSGSSGEVWRVVHSKTGDARVYKFAVHAEALNALKREITLFRLLRQQLGSEAPVAEMLDWNLEEAPYFIELEHYPAGSLAEWAAGLGGLASLPLSLRLRVFADLAEAVARVHGVGVLHKDLKPSNVLLRGGSGASTGTGVQPLLADFGGAGVMAEEVIANAGITRMGFTRLLDSAAQGTTLYVAPEVLEGQPQTIRGDVYALGVLLYQMVVGDFRKPIAPGWELAIDDELLRLDIAEATQGNPERRLSSAQALAERVRELDARREALAQQRRQASEKAAALQAAERVQRENETLRARRLALMGIVGVLLVGMATSLLLYWQAKAARQEAEHAKQVAQAVSNFLNYDMLAANEEEGRDTRDLTAKQLLDAAGKKIDTRFEGQPEVAAQVHTALSSSFMQIGDTATAIFHRSRGWDLVRTLAAEEPEAALNLAVELSPVDYTREQDADLWVSMRDRAIGKWGATDARTLLLRNAVALVEARQRNAAEAATAYAAIIRDAEKLPDYDGETLATFWEDLGQEQAALAQFAEAERAYQSSLAIYDTLYGKDSFAAVTAKLRYARLQITLAKLPAAEALIDTALVAGRAQRNQQNALVLAAERTQGLLRLEQGRLDEALMLFQRVLAAETVARGPESQQVVHAGYLIGLAHERRGDLAAAERQASQALRQQEAVPVYLLYGEAKKHADRMAYGLLLVRSLAQQGRCPAAEAAWKDTVVPSGTIAKVTALESIDVLEAEAQLLRCQSRAADASKALARAHQQAEKLLGAGHPRTKGLVAQGVGGSSESALGATALAAVKA